LKATEDSKQSTQRFSSCNHDDPTVDGKVGFVGRQQSR